jgi:selenocysteine lyase/cysteine desulfurase
MLTAESRVDSLFDELRRREFSRLDREGLAYLDYTGSALYAESQLRSHCDLLAHGVFGNPHSESAPSQSSTALIDDARSAVLRFVDADPDRYTVCFTANTTAAIKLVAESYPFGPHGALVLSADNHNSVNGLREYARRAGATVHYIPLDNELRLDTPSRDLCLAAAEHGGPKLFAFPAQSNFSGVHHSASLITEAQRLGFDVLVDAAAFAPSNRCSLREHAPEFVALSFYKLFGYPTGLGALIVRRDALRKLSRPWFAGGTVDFASVQNGIHQLKASEEAFEDGTPNFLGISALSAGFALLHAVGIDRAHDHVMGLMRILMNELASVMHRNGRPVTQLYGPRDTANRGGTVAFNVLSRTGQPIPYSLVECRARDAGVAIRGGCFCNPGAAERAFGFDATQARECMREVAAGERGFTIDRFARCLGADSAVGAVRASIGIANNREDIARVLAVVASFVQ